MSWLTGLAGKAEALLDRMDQVAAASLQSASPKKEEPALVTAPPRSESTPTLTEAAAKRSTPLPGPERYTKEQTSTTPRTALSQRSKQPPSDEALLNFLNTPSKETAGRETVQKEFASKRPLQTTPRPVPAMVPAQPKDEVGPVDVAIANKDTGDSTDGSKHQPSTDTDSAVAPTQSQQGSSEPSLQKGSDFEGTAIIQTHPEGNQLLQLQQKASNLELENKLLKEEVRSLTSELEVLRHHSAEMKDTLHHYESEVDSLREEVTRTDHMIRQLRSGEEDTKAELDARNSQIQVLRMQLEEADRTVEKLQTMANYAEKEKERVVQDVKLSNEAHGLGLATLQSQLEETQATLKSSVDAMEALKNEFYQRESQLQSEQKQLSEVVAMQQKQLSQKQAKYSECLASLQSAQNELHLLRKEHDDYKQRATSILQVKDKLIGSLQSGEGGPHAPYEARLEELRLGKEHLQLQLQTSQQQVDNMKADQRDMEERHSAEVEQLLDQIRVAEESLADEQKLHDLTKSELGRVTREQEDARAVLIQERTTLSSQLKEKDAEIKSLKQKLADASGTSGRAELEARMRELTESLIEKQTLLETFGAEKNSMQVQLSRLKFQLSDMQLYRPQQPTHLAVNGLESNDAAAPVRSISSAIPQNLNRVRKAANAVDRLSAQLGTLLRRYPYVRLFVLLYMLLLHLWVTLVLLTYKPETHASYIPAQN